MPRGDDVAPNTILIGGEWPRCELHPQQALSTIWPMTVATGVNELVPHYYCPACAERDLCPWCQQPWEQGRKVTDAD